ncbi:MAG: beta' subunit, partial [Paramarteilia canceri]
IQRYALKAQVRTGNRAGGIFENGFKGGIRFIGDDEVECLRIASNMLNNKIYTKQTGSEGELCKA